MFIYGINSYMRILLEKAADLSQSGEPHNTKKQLSKY